VKLLVLGVNGFIGNSLVARILSDTDWEVYGMDIRNDKLEACLGSKRFHYVEGDIGINKEWIERTAKVWDEIDESGEQFIIKRGNKIIKLSAEEDARWTAKAQPLFDDYVKKTKEMNLPGDEVVKFARDFIKKNRK